MNKDFTDKVQAWLDTPEAERNYQQGAVFFLQLSNNRIMYNNMVMNLGKYKEMIEYQIRKYMKFRLAQVTHEQVAQMAVKAEQIVAVNFPVGCGIVDEKSVETASFMRGKRDDHDSLPLEIQSLYVENLSILQQMRELHLQLRSLSVANSTCPDSERYPFLKELIALDKKYHHNWDVYDHYSGSGDGSEGSAAARTVEGDDVAKARSISRQISLLKGKYKKEPSDEIKDKIVALYAQLESPTERMTAELKSLGIIE